MKLELIRGEWFGQTDFSVYVKNPDVKKKVLGSYPKSADVVDLVDRKIIEVKSDHFGIGGKKCEVVITSLSLGNPEVEISNNHIAPAHDAKRKIIIVRHGFFGGIKEIKVDGVVKIKTGDEIHLGCGDYASAADTVLKAA